MSDHDEAKKKIIVDRLNELVESISSAEAAEAEEMLTEFLEEFDIDEEFDEVEEDEDGDEDEDDEEEKEEPEVSLPRKSPEVRVVLNGGKREMNNATIPLQVFLSDEVLAKKPTHIFVIDWSNSEKKIYSDGPDDEYVSNEGHRYVFKLTDGIQFLQMRRSGDHKIGVMFVRLDESNIQDCKSGFLDKMYCSRGYRTNFGVRQLEKFEFASYNWMSDFLVASCVVDIFVPELLLAKRPETRFQKLVWAYVNFLHKDEPRDQCQFKKRLIFLSLPKLPIVLVLGIVMLALYLGASAIATVVIPLACLLVLLLGWRPINPFTALWDFYSRCDLPDDIRAYEERLRWSASGYYNGATRKWENDKFIGFAPISLLFFLVPSFFAYLNRDSEGFSYWLFASCVGLACGVVFYFAASNASVIARARQFLGRWIHSLDGEARQERIQKKKLAQQEKERIRREQEQLQSLQWLKDNLSLAKQVDAVDVSKAPVALGSSLHQLKEKARIVFWAKKANACQPYEEKRR